MRFTGDAYVAERGRVGKGKEQKERKGRKREGFPANFQKVIAPVDRRAFRHFKL